MTKRTAKKFVARLNRRITRDNRAFAKMTPKQKRVQLAWDVREQILHERIVATPLTWINVDVTIGKKLGGMKVTPDTELSDVFKKVKQCDACAIGGLFLCAVERADKLKLREISGYDDDESESQNLDVESEAFPFLERFFERDQLNLIESAFEQGQGASGAAGGTDFAMDVDDPAERMRLIMENIIVHNGRFDPEDTPKATYSTPGFNE